MVFRRARGLALRPVQRIKHVVDSANTLASGTDLTIQLVAAADAPTLASTTGVITGAKVYGVYVKVVVASNEALVAGAVPNFYLMFVKNPGGTLTYPSPSAVGPYDNKRFVIHQEMTMIENRVSGIPTVVFDGVIKIPKGYSRFGPNDLLDLVVRSPQIDISVCVQAHYKEFR